MGDQALSLWVGVKRGNRLCHCRLGGQVLSLQGGGAGVVTAGWGKMGGQALSL